jgi:hypothetical protein
MQTFCARLLDFKRHSGHARAILQIHDSEFGLEFPWPIIEIRVA